jgi:hypothetical protein
MNVGEWLAIQAQSVLGYVTVTTGDWVEIAPHCYLNREAYDAGISTSIPRNLKGEAIPNVPIGNSLTPWREWGSENDGWRAKRSWL